MVSADTSSVIPAIAAAGAACAAFYAWRSFLTPPPRWVQAATFSAIGFFGTTSVVLFVGGIRHPMSWMYIAAATIGAFIFDLSRNPPRLTVSDLGRIAVSAHGWNFADLKRNEVTDFQDALRAETLKGPQHGGLVLMGRDNSFPYPKRDKERFQRQIIPPSHFNDHWLNLEDVSVDTAFPVSCNFGTSTQNTAGSIKGTFRDLSFADPRAALTWVRTIGHWRGKALAAAQEATADRLRKEAERGI